MVNFERSGEHPSGASRSGLRWFAIAAILLMLGVLSWSMQRSFDRIRRERVRVEALVDSLRSAQVPEQRLRSMERRLDDVERGLANASRAARLPDVIALRDWARRLDSRSMANSRRLAGVEWRLDTLSVAGPGRDSVTAND